MKAQKVMTFLQPLKKHLINETNDMNEHEETRQKRDT